MRLNRIKAIILLLSASLVALIGIQIYWVNNAFELKEEQFRQSVTKALDAIKMDLERKASSFEYYTDFNLNPNESFHIIKTSPPYQEMPDAELINIEYPDTVRSFNVSRIESKSLTRDLSGLSFPFPAKVRLVMKFEIPKDTISFNYPELLKSENLLKKETFDKFVSGEEPFFELISLDYLRDKIEKKLSDENIEQIYRYALMKESSSELVYISNNQDVFEVDEKNLLSTKLFTNNHFFETFILSIAFPNQRLSMVKAMWNVLLISVLIIALLIMAFWFSVRTIFKQKKLAIMKSDFMNNMTHEFKTPLSTMRLAIEMLKSGERDNTKRSEKFLEIIDKESKRLSSHIDRLLEMSALENGKFLLNTELLDMHNLINEVLTDYSSLPKFQNAKINFEKGAENSTLEGDKVHLSNLVYNLLDNAVKYNNQKPEIKIKTKNSENKLSINVSDNGIGIPEEDIDKVFEKFYRVPTGNKHDVKGFGLGLSYVKSIVDAHGGTIEVKSKCGHGTNFTIDLPIIK